MNPRGRSRRRRAAPLLAALLLLELSTPRARPQPAQQAASNRDPRWATPISVKGVPNLYQVSADLFRAGQLTNEGVPSLARKPLEIKTVVSLRYFYDDARVLSEGIFTRYGIHYDRIPSFAGYPEDRDVVSFLGIVATAPKPILVHCMHGADRTGFFCAIYRVVVQGWAKDYAVAEMMNGGYGVTSFLDGPARNYIRKMDVEKLKARAGLK